jgi:uncharacterized protein YjiS (DUF1127 family)
MLRCSKCCDATWSFFIMATFWQGSTEALAPASSLSLRDRLSHVGAWFAERQARSQALRELQSMVERDLRDLRISPYDFNEIANGTFRR